MMPCAGGLYWVQPHPAYGPLVLYHLSRKYNLEGTQTMFDCPGHSLVIDAQLFGQKALQGTGCRRQLAFRMPHQP